MDITDLLIAMTTNKASDLHLSSNYPPMLRINGDVVPFTDTPLTPDQVKLFIYSVMNEAQQSMYEKDLEIDFASFFFAEVFAIVTAFQHELSVDCNVASGSFKRQNGFLTGKCTRRCPLRASLWISVMFDWPLLVNSWDRLHHSPFVPE